MKKIVSVILTLILAFTLAACDSGNTQPEGTANPPQSEGNTSIDNEAEDDSGTAEPESTADAASAGGKVLIAYFSKTGNTETIANMIAGQNGGELFKVETVTPYPEDYDETVDIDREEQDNDARPELSTHVEDMNQYDVIYLGYPKMEYGFRGIWCVYSEKRWEYGTEDTVNRKMCVYSK